MSTPLPRVTQILADVGLGADFSMVSPAILAQARERGSSVHALIEAAAYGYLDEADVTPETAPYLDAYRKFMADSGAGHIASEIEVMHPAWQYVGHPDQLVWLAGKRTLLDFKTGGDVGADYQVAAYVDAYNAQHPTEPVAAGGIVALRADRSYRFREVEIQPALHVWHAALVVYRAQARPKEAS